MKKRKRNHKYKIEDILSGFDYTVDDFLKEQREQALQANEEKIDDKLYELELYLGRDMTEEEEIAILEIVDEYTPKDKDENYLVSLLPFEYAWEIYENKNEELDEFIGKLKIK